MLLFGHLMMNEATQYIPIDIVESCKDECADFLQ